MVVIFGRWCRRVSRTYLLIYHYRIDGHCDHPSGKINSKRKFRMRCNSGEASYRLGVLHKRWADSGRLVFEVLTNFIRTHDLGDWVLMGEYLYYSGNPPPPPTYTHPTPYYMSDVEFTTLEGPQGKY